MLSAFFRIIAVSLARQRVWVCVLDLGYLGLLCTSILRFFGVYSIFKDCSLGKQVWVHLLFAGRLACPIQDFKKSLSSFRGQRSLGLSLHFGFRLLVAIQSPTLDNELRVSLYFGFGLHQGMG